MWSSSSSSLNHSPRPKEGLSSEMRLAKEILLKMYEKMFLLRCFEEKSLELFYSGMVAGRIHSGLGQEAIAVGACLALQDRDYIISNHRGLGHCIAKGADIEKVFAEILGKSTGYSKGKGGPMHIADMDHGILGTTGIVGSGITVAVGAALANKLKGTKRVVLCFFGDGASNTGSFHEGLNLASTWGLSVVFICENNQYATSMPVSEAMAIPNIAHRAAGYRMQGYAVDGNDVISIYEAVSKAVGLAREGEGPILLEAKTYRLEGHFSGDPCTYRTSEEVERWRKKEPVALLRKRLLREKIVEEQELARVEERVQKEIVDAASSAIASPEASMDSILLDVYA